MVWGQTDYRHGVLGNYCMKTVRLQCHICMWSVESKSVEPDLHIIQCLFLVFSWCRWLLLLSSSYKDCLAVASSFQSAVSNASGCLWSLASNWQSHIELWRTKVYFFLFFSFLCFVLLLFFLNKRSEVDVKMWMGWWCVSSSPRQVEFSRRPAGDAYKDFSYP